MLLGKCDAAHADVAALNALVAQGKLERGHSTVAQLDGNVGRCRSLLADVATYKQQSNWYQLKQSAEEALAIAKYSASLFMLKARAHEALEEMQDALQATAHALNVEPESLEALQLRGAVYYAMDDTKLAMRHFRQALRLDPEHKGCKKLYRKVKKVEKTRKKAALLESQGRWEEAIAAHEELVASEENYSKLRVLKKTVRVKQAQIWKTLNDWEKVLASCQDAIDSEHNNAECHFLMGQAYEQVRRRPPCPRWLLLLLLLLLLPSCRSPAVHPTPVTPPTPACRSDGRLEPSVQQLSECRQLRPEQPRVPAVDGQRALPDAAGEPRQLVQDPRHRPPRAQQARDQEGVQEDGAEVAPR